MSYDTRNEALVGLGKVISSVEFSLGAEGSDTIALTAVCKDFNGVTLTDDVFASVFISADSAGVNQYTVDAVTTELSITSGGSGIYWGPIVATKMSGVVIQDGTLNMDVVDTATESIWFNIVGTNGQIFSKLVTFA